jgi:hypothetical protein
MTPPASPPAARHKLPSWLDLRLVLGVILVLVSVLAGAKLVSSADKTVRVWAARADLAAGTVLTDGDVRAVRVRLVDNAEQYLAVTRSPAGQTLRRDMGRDELIPAAALGAKPCGMLVSIPVGAQHVPSTVAKGYRVDVYATAKSGSKETVQVLRAVTVQAVQRPRGGLVGSGGEWSVVVRVPGESSVAVVQAVRGSDIDVTVVDEPMPGADSECGAPAQPKPTKPAADRSREPKPSVGQALGWAEGAGAR